MTLGDFQLAEDQAHAHSGKHDHLARRGLQLRTVAAEGRVLVRDQVEGVLKDGKVVSLTVTPESRKSSVIVHPCQDI